MNNKGLRQFIRKIYGFAFLNALVLLSPVYAIFMQEHGVSDMQLSTLFIFYSVGVAVAQFPVAWFGRLFGNKKTILFGQSLKALCFVIWFLVPNFWGFMIGFMLWGFQGAIYNVAYESLLYDELKARRHRDVYAKVLGRRKAISTVGSALSAAGSLLLFLGYEVILVASVTSVLLSALCIMNIKIRTKIQTVQKTVSFMKLFKSGVKIVSRTPCILYMLLLCTMVGNLSYLDDYFSLIGLEIGLRKEFVGAVPFFIMCCQIVGQMVAHKFQKIKDSSLYGFVSFAGLIFVAFACFYSVPGLLLLGFAYIAFSIIKILMYTRFQDFIPVAHRPIALSLYSISDNVMYVGSMLLIGVGSTIGGGGWRYGILIMGMACVFLGMWAILFVKDKCAITIVPPKTKMQKVRVESTSSNSPSKF